MSRAGSWVQQQGGPEGFAAFIPAPLPPDPPVAFTPELLRIHEEAVHAVGQLEGVSGTMDPDRLLYMYVRKEAVLSSQIEGTQSTLSDLLEYENDAVPGTPLDDVQEVSRYVAALYHGLGRIQRGELPLSLRLIRELHGVLMQEGRGSAQAPGDFRRTQNWIGGSRPGNARFVPPPPHEMMTALGNLERFLHDEYGRTAPIVKAGLAHAQFETIHPFLDGNGRIGRLLISLILGVEGLLTRPFFYFSLYLRENRAEYYDALQRVRTHGDWEGWLHFYLVGVDAVARQAAGTTLALRALFEEDQQRVAQLGRAAGSALRVYDLLRQRIVLSAPRAAAELGFTWPTVNAALQRLERAGIAREVTGRSRDRLYVYARQLELLNAGTRGGAPVAEGNL
ncbi:MAG TPA: Fic family protein [Longimicrobium sp.]|jgi:Fic family protein|uniref:Fic family protein n=1 Tax=Longimicrobium sp. TaxID=2029185 RepID=UPI002EDBB6DC